MHTDQQLRKNIWNSLDGREDSQSVTKTSEWPIFPPISVLDSFPEMKYIVVNAADTLAYLSIEICIC